ncbi:MAG TPA: 50S ribosomal protein L3 [Nitrososphaerales archaeon]|nr:50S ribosomal protein L3 [Nitrososphaerales archaeon]HUK74938.1 50S ribosomal protein L3 [Nitrososphaerales archaeon]
MGHRKHSAPRRGSLAYIPRGRVGDFFPTVHNWPKVKGGAPNLLGFPAVKVSTIHTITVDDREKTPNFGKPRFNPTSVLAVPDAAVVGVRLYVRENGAEKAVGETYAKSLPKRVEKKSGLEPDKFAEAWKPKLAGVTRVAAIVSMTPRDAGLSQKEPIIFEVGVGGGDTAAQLDYAVKAMGKPVKFSEVFKAGGYVDVIGVTKGHGYEGPVTRMGIKRKQHKSRKSVRAVGVIGPWHPAAVMYTVARAGQHGFHQRTESGKRILTISNSKDGPITPKGGFEHFGDLTTDYALVRGSVPGSNRRVVVVRQPMRPHPKAKTAPVQVLEVSTRTAR